MIPTCWLFSWLTWMQTIFMVSILKYFNFIQNFNFLKLFLLNSFLFSISGWDMSVCLLVDGFEWVEEELTESDIMNKPEDDSTGLILEVDLKIPEHLHDYFSDYVPAPEHVKITKHMLSLYSKECMEKLNVMHTATKNWSPIFTTKKNMLSTTELFNSTFNLE